MSDERTTRTADDPDFDPLEGGRSWPDEDDDVKPGPPDEPWTGFLGGVDTSKWQGTPVDAPRMAASGVRYWWTRAGNGTKPDALVGHYAEQAAARGIPFGLYTFFRPVQDPEAQATLLVDATRRLGCSLVPQLDIEHDDGLGADRVGPAVRSFARAVQQGLGVAPVLYTGAPFWNVKVRVDDLGDLPLWVARYPTTRTPPADPAAWGGWAQALNRPPSLPMGWDRFDLWQFSAQGNGAAPTYGFPKGDLDLNICRPDAWDRLQLAGARPGAATAPATTSQQEEPMSGVPLYLVRRNDRPDDPTIYAFDGIRARALVDDNDRNVLVLLGAHLGGDGQPVPIASSIIDAALPG